MTTPFVYTGQMNKDLLEFQKTIIQPVRLGSGKVMKLWKKVHEEFKKEHAYTSSWMALYEHARRLLRHLRYHKVAAQSSQQSEGDKPQEESHPLPPATSDLPLFVSLDSFDYDVDTGYESDFLPESRVVFNVSSDMLKSFTNDPMDVIDQDELIDQDEPAQDDQRVVKRRNITIRVDSFVATPPQVPMLEVLTF